MNVWMLLFIEKVQQQNKRKKKTSPSLSVSTWDVLFHLLQLHCLPWACPSPGLPTHWRMAVCGVSCVWVVSVVQLLKLVTAQCITILWFWHALRQHLCDVSQIRHYWGSTCLLFHSQMKLKILLSLSHGVQQGNMWNLFWKIFSLIKFSKG